MSVGYLKAAISILCCCVATLPQTAYSCGWWGDGEVNRLDTVVMNRTDGKPLSGNLSLETSMLPRRMGYGIVVPDPGQAIPYLVATHGREISRIGDLRVFGFQTVIDLGTPPEIARKHRQETEASGMRYFNIPLDGSTPSLEQAERFSRLVIENSQHPLLVYAPTSALLGAMWASYRISLGAPLGFAIKEGRALGMMPGQEAKLRKRAQQSGE
jgi:protein tyrosine phosphatase (PTP) superfamily phosphohydrolase (DUF442 family)